MFLFYFTLFILVFICVFWGNGIVIVSYAICRHCNRDFANAQAVKVKKAKWAKLLDYIT